MWTSKLIYHICDISLMPSSCLPSGRTAKYFLGWSYEWLCRNYFWRAPNKISIAFQMRIHPSQALDSCVTSKIRRLPCGVADKDPFRLVVGEEAVQLIASTASDPSKLKVGFTAEPLPTPNHMLPLTQLWKVASTATTFSLPQMNAAKEKFSLSIYRYNCLKHMLSPIYRQYWIKLSFA